MAFAALFGDMEYEQAASRVGWNNPWVKRIIRDIDVWIGKGRDVDGSIAGRW